MAKFLHAQLRFSPAAVRCAIIATSAPSTCQALRWLRCVPQPYRQSDSQTERQPDNQTVQTFSLNVQGSQPANSEPGQSEANACQRGAFSLRMRNDEQSIIASGGCFRNDGTFVLPCTCSLALEWPPSVSLPLSLFQAACICLIQLVD